MADGSKMPNVGPGENLITAIWSRTKNKGVCTGANWIEILNNRAPRISYAHIVDQETSEVDQYVDEFGALEVEPTRWNQEFAAEWTEMPNKRFDPINRDKRVQWKEEQ